MVTVIAQHREWQPRDQPRGGNDHLRNSRLRGEGKTPRPLGGGDLWDALNRNKDNRGSNIANPPEPAQGSQADTGINVVQPQAATDLAI
uniref:Uncharacterized protein n=1 Tax=Cannabis sativa TaxID=3483 RepID=A0A803PVS2_CANSA